MTLAKCDGQNHRHVVYDVTATQKTVSKMRGRLHVASPNEIRGNDPTHYLVIEFASIG